MNIYESKSMTFVADDGIIHYIIDRNDPHTANYADKRGKTGAAVWTLKGEDIKKEQTGLHAVQRAQLGRREARRAEEQYNS